MSGPRFIDRGNGRYLLSEPVIVPATRSPTPAPVTLEEALSAESPGPCYEWVSQLLKRVRDLRECAALRHVDTCVHCNQPTADHLRIDDELSLLCDLELVRRTP